MARRYSYEEALRILGAGESAVLNAADHASATALLGLGAFNLFEARATLFELGNKLRRTLGARLRGYDRMSRTERIHAACTVLAIVAVVEVIDEGWRSLGAPELPLDRADQSSITGPLTGASLSSADIVPAVSTRFAGDAAMAFISGLAQWDALNDTQKDRFRDFLDVRSFVPAVQARFREYQVRMAADCPEFGIWLSLGEQERTRSAVRRGFEDLQTALEAMSASRIPDTWRASLARVHRAVLDKAVTQGDSTADDMRIPTLAEAFIDHHYRVASHDVSMVGQESWWGARPVEKNIEEFIAAHLLSEPMTPLLVLGHPGSGKSVLTRILGARLPAEDFLVVRVELRQARAEADLVDQLEAAIRQTLNESVSWPRLVAAAAGAQPVVILDGFDELLQATGVSQSDYLVRVQRFQEREADLGRPVAVIVTSRTAVADRAEIPAGTRVIRLEPFDAAQIAAWLETWNRTNAAALARRGLRPLAVEHALHYPDLASQPLLLLLLALYDASANALQVSGARLDRTELYGQLLREFARREISKDLVTGDLEALVDRELVQLSIVAFAMSNRRAQWIDEDSLNADLTALGLGKPEAANTRRKPLTPAHLLIGRFFFVHGSQATHDGEARSTYEFLHATFGEFLIASLTVQLLVEAALVESASTFAATRLGSDAMLYALLSFECLASRTPVIEFLTALLGRQSPELHETIEKVLLRFHSSALDSRNESAFAAYTPRPANIPERLAIWSANLVILATITAGRLSAELLFPGGPESAIAQWHRATKRWRASLPGGGWQAFVSTIAVERTGRDGSRALILSPGGCPSQPPSDMAWTIGIHASRDYTDFSLDPGSSVMRSNAQVSLGQDVTYHALAPLMTAFPTLTHRLVRIGDGRIVSLAHVLTEVLVAPGSDSVRRLGEAIAATHRDVFDVAEHDRFVGTAYRTVLTAVATSNLAQDDLDHFCRTVGIETTATGRSLPAFEASLLPSPSPAASSPDSPAKPPPAP